MESSKVENQFGSGTSPKHQMFWCLLGVSQRSAKHQNKIKWLNLKKEACNTSCLFGSSWHYLPRHLILVKLLPARQTTIIYTLVKMHRGRWIAYYHGMYNYTLLFLVPCNSIETSPKPETNKSRVPCIHSTLVQDKMSVSNKMHKCVHHVQQQNALLMCSCKAFVGLGCKNPFTSMSATMFASTHKVVTLFLLFRFWWNRPSGLKTISFDF